MVKVKSGHYYFDNERNLLYVTDSIVVNGFTLWKFICLSTNQAFELDTDSLEHIILTQDLGPTIAPAMRLLYGAAQV